MDGAERGRLATRPRGAAGGGQAAAGAGPRELSLDGIGRAWLRLPATSAPSPDPAGAPEPLPLVVALHGAGGRAPGMLTMLGDLADRYGFAVLAPQSTRPSWDRIQGRYGPDVRLLDAALDRVFADLPVDADHLAVSGFSDGASYALSLGIANGDLFGHVMAWSPGFAAPEVVNGRPRMYVSHGTRDEVLPVDLCSRRLVTQLRSAGYDVVYDEFDGPHVVPPELLDRSFRWFLDDAAERTSVAR